MAYTELKAHIPMIVDGKGPGRAIAVIDYSPEDHLIWVVVLDVNGAIWCASNPAVRVQENWTLGRA